MTNFSFKNKVIAQYNKRISATAPVPEVDAYIFCTSSKYLGESLFPWQSLVIKIIYGLWEKYPITEIEQIVVDQLKEDWHIELDLENRDVNQFIEILILVLGRRAGKCLKGDSLVIDPKTGDRVPIKDLYKGGVARVLTLKDNFKFKKVCTSQIHDNGIKDCYKLTTRTGREISATPNHKFLTINGWEKLKDLNPGDRIAVPRKIDIAGKEVIPDHEVRFLGFFIGDGHTVNKFNFTNINPIICDTFDKDIKTLSPDLVIRRRGIDRNIVQPSLTRVIDKTDIRKFAEKYKLYGKRAWEKSVPVEIFQSTNRQVGLFLSAIYACDGWVDKKSIGYTSTSRQLIKDMQHLLLRFGINAAIRTNLTPFYKDKNGNKVICRPAYRLEITSTEDIHIFVTYIDIIGKSQKLQELSNWKGVGVYHNTQAQSIPQGIWKRIKEKVSEKALKVDNVFKGLSIYRSSQYAPNRKMVKEFGTVLKDTCPENLADSNIHWEPIKSIEYDGKHRTYDLTVDDTHNFICNDIVTHNSSCISFIQTYEAYKLICKGDPQKYYKLRSRHPIWIVNCLPGNTLVTLSDGNTKRIDALTKGDSVLSKNEEGLIKSEIVDVWRSGKKDILEIKTGNRTIESSEGHKFYKLLPGKGPSIPRKAEWVDAKTLKKGDYIGILTKTLESFGDTLPNGDNATEDIMEQFGLYIGDGSVYMGGRGENTGGVLTIALPDSDVKKSFYIEQAKRAFHTKEKFKTPSFIGAASRKERYQVYSTSLCKFILNESGFKHGAKNKTVPDWVFGLKTDLKKAFLRGIIHSDGSTDKNGISTISLPNEHLISRIRDLCISIGWNVSNITTFYMRTNYGEGPIWRFIISPNGTNKQFKNHPICDGVEWARIRNITQKKQIETFDLEVRGTHNFFANGVFVHNCAKDGDQAQDPFRLCKDNIRRIPFFEKYVDWTKDNESELRLFTPADLYENSKIQKYNESRTKGKSKKNLLEGSIMIAAFTTSAASKRGKAIACLILDEFAHFDRAKSVGGGATEEDILSEMPQTDYAMLKALSPSTKDFNLIAQNIYDGKIILISSPREKGGEFYRHYCLAGGWEQTNPHRDDINPNYFMLQLSSWQCNPKYPRLVFNGDFKKDPAGANMEYGGHFGEPSTSFISADRIDAMVNPDRPMRYEGEWQANYIISLDPASKSDTYVVAWGHREGDMTIVDGLQGFRPKIEQNPVTDKVITIPVQSDDVANFVIELAAKLNVYGNVLEVVFDQWNAQTSLTKLGNAGLIAVETFFSNKYKNVMYTNFLEMLNIGLVQTYGKPPLTLVPGFPEYKMGWLEQAKLELKYLTKIVQADVVKYSAPTSGPIQTDDFADALANLVHRHVLYASGDRNVYKDLYKQTGRPIKHASLMRARMTSSFFGGRSTRQDPAAIRSRLGDRIGRH